jgi:excisionase family DNA binding protein
VNGPASDVLTLAEAAAYLRLAETEVVRLVHTQGLPGRFTGSEWRFLKTAIQQWLSTGGPTTETRKAAQLLLAGSFKDDSDLEAIVEEAMRLRGRRVAEDD